MKIFLLLFLAFSVNCALYTYVRPMYECIGVKPANVKWAADTIALLPVNPISFVDSTKRHAHAYGHTNEEVNEFFALKERDTITELGNIVIMKVFFCNVRPTEIALKLLGDEIERRIAEYDPNYFIHLDEYNDFLFPRIVGWLFFGENDRPDVVLFRGNEASMYARLVEYVEKIATMTQRIIDNDQTYIRVFLENATKTDDIYAIQFKKSISEYQDSIISSAIRHSFKNPISTVSPSLHDCTFMFVRTKFMVLHLNNGFFREIGSFQGSKIKKTNSADLERFWADFYECIRNAIVRSLLAPNIIDK